MGDFYMDNEEEYEEMIKPEDEIVATEEYIKKIQQDLFLRDLVVIECYKNGFSSFSEEDDVVSRMYDDLVARKKTINRIKLLKHLTKFKLFTMNAPTYDYRYSVSLEKVDECIDNYKEFSNRLYYCLVNMIDTNNFEKLRDFYLIFLNLNALLDFSVNYMFKLIDIAVDHSKGIYSVVPDDYIYRNNINIRKLTEDCNRLGI